MRFKTHSFDYANLHEKITLVDGRIFIKIRSLPIPHKTLNEQRGIDVRLTMHIMKPP